MHENFLIDMLNFSSENKETKQAIIHWFWGNVERRRRILFKHYFIHFPFSTLDEYALLNLISIKSKITLTQASMYLFQKRSTTSEMFKRFCAKGITIMKFDEIDRRIKFYSLSKEGVKIIHDANLKMKEMNAFLFEHLQDDNIFLGALRGIYEKLDEQFHKQSNFVNIQDLTE